MLQCEIGHQKSELVASRIGSLCDGILANAYSDDRTDMSGISPNRVQVCDSTVSEIGLLYRISFTDSQHSQLVTPCGLSLRQQRWL